NLGREALVFELLLDARRCKRTNSVRADQAACHDEAGQLVAGQKGFVKRRQLRDLRWIEMSHDGLRNFGLALLAKPRNDQPGMLLRPPVVIGVVQESGDRPAWLISVAATVTMCRPPHRRLDRPGVIPERGVLRPLV